MTRPDGFGRPPELPTGPDRLVLWVSWGDHHKGDFDKVSPAEFAGDPAHRRRLHETLDDLIDRHLDRLKRQAASTPNGAAQPDARSY